MKITTVREEVIRENNSKRTIVKVYGEVKPSDSREPLCLVPAGSYVGQGVSNCHPEDELDEVVGYRLARSRAYRNLYNIVLAEQMKLRNSFENLLEDTVYRSARKYEGASMDQTVDIIRTLQQGSGGELDFDESEDELMPAGVEERILQIIEKFEEDGVRQTSVRVTDVGDCQMGFYVHEETVFCLSDGSDFWFGDLSEEEQVEAVRKLVDQADYKIDNTFC